MAGFVVINWFFTLQTSSLLDSEFSLGPTEKYDVLNNFILNTLTGIVAGGIGGSVLVFFNNKVFRKRSYGFALKATFLAFSLSFLCVSVIMAFFAALVVEGPNITIQVVQVHLNNFLFSKLALTYYFFWLGTSMITLFFLQMTDKFGPGMFLKFLMGKYNQPLEEKRIFMFLDMKSSTTIAEKIGNTQYFNLISEVFSDITDPILETDGEIYQYVGDEIVISWELEKGIRNANCFVCFLKIQELLTTLAPAYRAKYGVDPAFKAGLHYGPVTAGEVGTIKKDIVYSGDVLNTTSRIQEQCKEYGVDFLISKETLELIQPPKEFDWVTLGNIELRGKSKKIDLETYQVSPN